MPIQLEKNIEQTLNHAFNHYTCQNDTLSKFMIFHHVDLVWGCDRNKCVPKSIFNLYANAYFVFHFALQFITFNKIHNGHHYVGWKRFDASFELPIFPPCYKFALHKMLQFWF